MAWNDNDNDNNKNSSKDPWSGRDKQAGPPDLDELVRKIKKRIAGFLGQKKASGYDSNKPPVDSGGSPPFAPTASLGVLLALLIIFALWFVSGFFIVQPAERAVVLRFGQYKETLLPGLHWVPRIIESASKVNIQQIYTYTYPPNDDTHMLTKDENIISVAVTVQYRIDDPRNFLYNVADPIGSLKQATASAMRQVVGLYNLDDVLTTGREQIRSQIEQTLEDIIARYHSGIYIVNVSIKSASAPEQVKDAFDDAIKAREDQQKIVNQAQAYAMQVGPIAQGEAQKTLELANAFGQRVVLNAQANTAAFLALLPEYKSAPAVMRERLYLDTMESVLKDVSKIFVDNKGSSNVLYLPLDKMMKTNSALPLSATTPSSSQSQQQSPSGTNPQTPAPDAAQTANSVASANDLTNKFSRPSRPIDNGSPYLNNAGAPDAGGSTP